MKAIVYVLLGLILISSCSVQKRKYNKGYYVSLLSKSKKVNSNRLPANIKNERIVTRTVISDDVILASVNNSLVLTTNYKRQDAQKDTCDLIVLMNGEEIEAIVSEISHTEIKYKNCSHQRGPTMVIYKKDVLFIKYPTGEKYIVDHKNDVVDKPTSTATVEGASPTGKEGKTDEGAIVGFFLAIVGLPITIWLSALVGAILLVVALIISVTSIARIKKNPRKLSGSGLATGGIIVSILGLALAILYALALFAI